VEHSSTFCRTQEEHHRALASSSTLPNSRRIATVAANAWAIEAALATAREERGGPDLSDGDAAIAAEFRLEEEEEARNGAASCADDGDDEDAGPPEKEPRP
jgi:hypothetical protein